MYNMPRTCLFYYVKTLSLSYISDQREILFMKKIQTCDNSAVWTVSTLNKSTRNILFKYSTQSLSFSKKVKGEGKRNIAVSSNLASALSGTHVLYGITQCYLPPCRGDIPAFTPALDLATLEGCKAELIWWLVKYRGGLPTQRRSPIPALTGLDVEQLR